MGLVTRSRNQKLLARNISIAAAAKTHAHTTLQNRANSSDSSTQSAPAQLIASHTPFRPLSDSGRSPERSRPTAPPCSGSAGAP